MNLPKEGQILHCRRCDEPLYKLRRDIIPGEMQNNADLFTNIGEQPPAKMGQKAKCHKCGNDLDFYNIRGMEE